MTIGAFLPAKGGGKRNAGHCDSVVPMKFPTRTLLCVLFLGSVSASAQLGGQLFADLDGDGEAETVSWVPFAEDADLGTFYRLQVSDPAGNVIWKGAELKDIDHPMIFGEWHFGVSLPQLVADIDLDGKIELVAPEPQSDVSPTWFRILEWRQGRFYLSRSAALLETPKGSGTFVWYEGEDYTGTWISEFSAANSDGSYAVKIFRYDGGEHAEVNEAGVVLVENGFQLDGNGIVSSMPRDEDLEAWIMQQRWFVKLSDSMPPGVMLAVETDLDDPAWIGVGIREIHSADSGFDPNVAPTVGHFRISADRESMHWLDPVNATWSTMDAFFKSRRLNLLAE